MYTAPRGMIWQSIVNCPEASESIGYGNKRPEDPCTSMAKFLFRLPDFRPGRLSSVVVDPTAVKIIGDREVQHDNNNNIVRRIREKPFWHIIVKVFFFFSLHLLPSARPSFMILRLAFLNAMHCKVN